MVPKCVFSTGPPGCSPAGAPFLPTVYTADWTGSDTHSTAAPDPLGSPVRELPTFVLPSQPLPLDWSHPSPMLWTQLWGHYTTMTLGRGKVCFLVMETNIDTGQLSDNHIKFPSILKAHTMQREGGIWPGLLPFPPHAEGLGRSRPLFQVKLSLSF